MKLKYIGAVNRDGSRPAVQIGEDFVELKDGYVDVPDSADAASLIATGHFISAGKVFAPAKAPPKLEVEPDDLAFTDTTDDETTFGDVDETIKALNTTPPVAETDKDVLLARAKELGIPANTTWGVSSLIKAIAKAEK